MIGRMCGDPPREVHQSIEVQEAGGARDWNAVWTELRCANSARLAGGTSATVCGNASRGGETGRKLLASDSTAQIAQSVPCRSVSRSAGDWTPTSASAA